MRRITGLLVVSLALLAGCSSGDDDPARDAGPTASATVAVDAVAAVKSSMDKSLESTVQIEGEITAGPAKITLSGSVDPDQRLLTMVMVMPERTEVLGIGDTIYLKQSGTGTDSWIRVDMTKLSATSQLRQSFDLRSQTGILGGIVSAEQVSPGRYRGVADLNKAAAAAPEASRESLETAARTAKNASAVPFEATLDEQGRLTSLDYTLEAAPGPVETSVRLSNFGAPVTVTAPPADQVVDAPDSVYKNL